MEDELKKSKKPVWGRPAGMINSVVEPGSGTSLGSLKRHQLAEGPMNLSEGLKRAQQTLFCTKAAAACSGFTAECQRRRILKAAILKRESQLLYLKETDCPGPSRLVGAALGTQRVGSEQDYGLQQQLCQAKLRSSRMEQKEPPAGPAESIWSRRSPSDGTC